MSKRLLHKRLLVLLGPGGVGKTTAAAAVALAAARIGRRAAVITFDPSRRLKDALGLTGLSSDPVEVAIGDARFDALALDTKRTFDEVVERFAPDRATAQRILANRLYQELSSEISGSAEYMAMEKLHHLLHHGDYDLVIVDTPPSAHARDLLAAPNRLSALIASRAVNILQAPTSLLSGIDSSFGRFTLTALLRALERWTGLQLLSDLGDFVTGFETMLEGFSKRAGEIGELLRAPQTGFVLVTSPEAHTVETTAKLHQELVIDQFPVQGIIANRVLAFSRPQPHHPTLESWSPEMRRRLIANQEGLYILARRDRQMLAELQHRTQASLLAIVPMAPAVDSSQRQLETFAAHLG